MRTLLYRLRLIGGSCVLFATSTVPLASQAIPISGEAVSGFDPIDRSAVQLMQRYSIPGMALGITKAGRLVFAHGYGYADVESHSPVLPDTLFRLASVSNRDRRG